MRSVRVAVIADLPMLFVHSDNACTAMQFAVHPAQTTMHEINTDT